MPYGNGTGPRGQGSRTGRRLGFCSGYSEPGSTTGQKNGVPPLHLSQTNDVGYGRGGGRGAGNGRGTGYGRGAGNSQGIGYGRRAGNGRGAGYGQGAGFGGGVNYVQPQELTQTQAQLEAEKSFYEENLNRINAEITKKEQNTKEKQE